MKVTAIDDMTWQQTMKQCYVVKKVGAPSVFIAKLFAKINVPRKSFQEKNFLFLLLLFFLLNKKP